MVTDIATIGKSQTDAEVKQEELEDKDREIESLKDDLEHERAVKNINALRDEWESKVLRKTTLKSQYAMNGKVYFHNDKTTEYFKIYFPLGDVEFELIFKQEVIQTD